MERALNYEGIMKVKIIGAGLAGCSIAMALQDVGHDVELFDINQDYSGWAICTGKIFPPKSEGVLATRLFEGYNYYRFADMWSESFPLLGRLYDECVKSAQEYCNYKNPIQSYKRLKNLVWSDYDELVSCDDKSVIVKGFQFNAQKAVSIVRNEFKEHIDNPDLLIWCRGAWERGDLSPFKVTPVRGVTAEIIIKDAPDDVMFHWPASGMYYVPTGNADKFAYGTVLVPDSSFGGVKSSDKDKLFHSDNSYMMADWVRDNYGVKVSMSGAEQSMSVGYRPWLRGKIPGYFKYNEGNLYVNGLYQSGAQLFFWLGINVAHRINNLKTIERDLNHYGVEDT